MKFPKRTMGYAVAFTAGTLLSGSVAFAASNYVQAQKAQTSVQYHGSTLSNPPGLVYGGSMYVQLYSIQQAMKKAGFTAGWNGSTFALNENSTAKLSGGTSDNQTTWLDLAYSKVTVQSGAVDFIAASEDVHATPQSITTVLDRLIGNVSDNITALQKDTPTDANLITIQTEFINALKEVSTSYSDLEVALKTNSSADMQKFDTDIAQADNDLQKAAADLSAYQAPTSGSSLPSAARFSGAHVSTSFAHDLTK